MANRQRKIDKRKKRYKSLTKNAILAELVGIILGDGHIHRFPRTEHLVVTCGSDKAKYIKRIAGIVAKIFDKTPNVLRRNIRTAFDISLYQCSISQRLGIPPGNKIKNNIGIPAWIKNKRKYALRCLKGLFETDGCFQKDVNNYAQYIELKNFCKQIRLDTYAILIKLGYHPQLSKTYVRLAREKEVYSFKKLINFRKY